MRYENEGSLLGKIVRGGLLATAVVAAGSIAGSKPAEAQWWATLGGATIIGTSIVTGAAIASESNENGGDQKVIIKSPCEGLQTCGIYKSELEAKDPIEIKKHVDRQYETYCTDNQTTRWQEVNASPNPYTKTKVIILCAEPVRPATTAPAPKKAK